MQKPVDFLRKLLDLSRAIFISPELVFTLLATVGFLVFPEVFDAAGTRFKAEQELWKYLAALPGLLLAWTAKEGMSALFPMKDSNNILANWEDYWRLKLRIYVAVGWTLACLIAALAAWIMNNKWSARSVGFLYLASICVSFVAAATVWICHINVRQILEADSDR